MNAHKLVPNISWLDMWTIFTILLQKKMDETGRVRCYKVLHKYLHPLRPEPSVYTKLLEESVYAAVGQDYHSYVSKVKQLIYNCQKRPELLTMYPPSLLAVLSDAMLSGCAPVSESEDLSEDRVAVSKGLDKCRACGSYDIVYKQIQTRSADEGMTLISRCRDCGKTWRN